MTYTIGIINDGTGHTVLSAQMTPCADTKPAFMNELGRLNLRIIRGEIEVHQTFRGPNFAGALRACQEAFADLPDDLVPDANLAEATPLPDHMLATVEAVLAETGHLRESEARVVLDELRRLRAQLAELSDRLLTEQLEHDQCHGEYDDVLSQCGDWSERCAKLEAERDAAIREVGEWATRAGSMESRCESRESTLRECLRLAETGDCGAIAIAVEAALGEVTP